MIVTSVVPLSLFNPHQAPIVEIDREKVSLHSIMLSLVIFIVNWYIIVPGEIITTVLCWLKSAVPAR